jgi:hypothetical protein
VLGLVLLAALAFKAFLDRVLPAVKEIPAAQARREVPFMAEAAVREPSGAHRSL